MGHQLSTYKNYRRGTHRCASPHETMERIEKYLPVFGITRIANITGLDYLGIPVVMVTRPNSRSLSVSQGKGATLISAKISGIMESIETFHAERFYGPSLLLSYEDIFYKHAVVSIDQVSRSNFKELSPTAKIYWNKGIDLLNDGQDIWIPHALVHTDYTVPLLPDHSYFITDTNGLASGNTKLEAINHALCEVVERDALALWDLKTPTEQDAQRIDLATIDNQNCLDLLQKFGNADICFGIWDITTDIGLPCYICKIAPAKEEPGNGIRPVYGSGCHLDKYVALSRAITEAAQSRLTFISGSRDDQYRSVYKKFLNQEIMNEWRSNILGGPGNKNFNDCITYETEFLEEDQQIILNCLKNVGIRQATVVDLTREEYNIPVVKVIVPGLESISNPESRIPGNRAAQILQAGSRL